MARSSTGLTLILALGILVAVPVGTMVWYRSWRARLMEPLSPLPTGTARPEHPVAPTEEPPHAELRPVDTLLIGVFEGKGPPPGADLMPDGPRVDLEAGPDSSVARVDLDRDGKWDEVWTIEPDGLLRAVSPDDDGRQTQTYAWMGGDWVPQPAGAQ